MYKDSKNIYRNTDIKILRVPDSKDENPYEFSNDLLRNLNSTAEMYEGLLALKLQLINRNGELNSVLSVTTSVGLNANITAFHNSSVKECTSLLSRYCYDYVVLAPEEMHELLPPSAETTVCLTKNYENEYSLHGQNMYSLPVCTDFNLDVVFSTLNHTSNSMISIEYIPQELSQNEKQILVNNYLSFAQQKQGITPMLSDTTINRGLERWEYLNKSNSFGFLNIIISGNQSDAIELAAAIKTANRNVPMKLGKCSDYWSQPVYKRPWCICDQINLYSNSIGFNKWTTEEVSRIFALPKATKYHTGFLTNPVSYLPETISIPKISSDTTRKYKIGNSLHYGNSYEISINNFLYQTIVCGKSGRGKSTFLRRIIKTLHNNKVPTLIIELAKKEYRSMLRSIDMKVFTVENSISPLWINPFLPPKGVKLSTYIGALTEAFKSALSLPDPLPAILEDTIPKVYMMYGWTGSSYSDDPNATIFGISEFIQVFRKELRNQYAKDVSQNIITAGTYRMNSLIDRLPMTLDTLNSTSIEDILSGTVLIELGALATEQRSLVTALLLISIDAYMKSNRGYSGNIENTIIIDEAHTILDTGDYSTVEGTNLSNSIINIINTHVCESRGLGIANIICDQSPSKLSGIIDNVDNVISFCLSGSEAEMMNTTISGSKNSSLSSCLPLLKTGEFVMFNNELSAPVLFKNCHENIDNLNMSDDELKTLIGDPPQKEGPYIFCKEHCKTCSYKTREFAQMYATQFYSKIESRIKATEDKSQLVNVVLASFRDVKNTIETHRIIDSGCITEQVYRCILVHLSTKLKQNGVINGTEKLIKKLMEEQ